MLPESRITVLIPTRNRAALAAAAVRSVTTQGVAATVIVSDNSTSKPDREALAAFCATADPATVRLVRPPTSLSMSQHWQWAMRSAISLAPASHYALLTDRMVFKPGHLPELLERAARFPSDVISYNYDKVEDSSLPVHLELEPWSGELLALDAAHLLRLSSRGVYSNALPRMLNTVVPRTVLDAVERRFGTLFASISPDLCFAYRCLAVVDRILYFDKALLLQYAVGRSQGLNYARGIKAPEVVDFAAMLGGTAPTFSSAPIPELQTVGNATFHEYGFVRAEAKSAKFPEIDRWNYLGAIAWDSRALRDRRWAAEVRQRLRAEGWTAFKSGAWVIGRAIPALLHRPGQLLAPVRVRTARRFASTDEALTYATQHPRAKTASLAHQWQLQPKPVEAAADGRNHQAGALMPQ